MVGSDLLYSVRLIVTFDLKGAKSALVFGGGDDFL